MNAYWLESKAPISNPELKAQGVSYEPIALDNPQPALDRIKRENGYVTQDIVELTPATPGLEAIKAKFDKEHLHTDDEVRFVLEGAGIFDIRSADNRWMRVEVAPGDYISVPANRHHRFFCTQANTIRCIRLFKDNSGWSPIYRNPLDTPMGQS